MTAAPTPKERLEAHTEKLKARGVRDVKFAYGDLYGTTVDQLALEVADMLDAIEREEYTKIGSNFCGDSVMPLKNLSPGARCSGASSGERGNEANEESGTP